MARRQRDYRAERERARARDLELGYSVSQSRGHPRAGELSKRETRHLAELTGISLRAVIRWTALGHWEGRGTSMFMVPGSGAGHDSSVDRDSMQALRGFASKDLTLTSVIGTRANGEGVPLREMTARRLLDEAEFLASVAAAIEALKYEFHKVGKSPILKDQSPIVRVHLFAAIGEM